MEKITFKSYLKELKNHSQYNFCDYSDNSINRRLEKILLDYNLTLEELLEKTQNDPSFVEKVVDAITVNTTELFRNPETWIYLFNHVYKQLHKKSSINIWHAGCSTGQEVYSSLILLNELGLLSKVNVVASDLNSNVISKAKKGEYSFKINKSYIKSYQDLFKRLQLNTNSFEDYFELDKDNDIIKVKDFIRSKPIFKKHDLVEEKIPFYQKFDVIFCRNVLIYFNGDLQLNIVRKFFDKLYDGGSLVLGTHEALHGFFKTRFNKHGMVYTKSNSFHYKYK